MMPDKLKLEIVTEQRLLVSEEVDAVSAPGEVGYFQVLPGHVPFLTLLAVGEICYTIGQRNYYVFMGEGGYAEVLPDKVLILARVAERAEEIDVARAEAALKRAQQRLVSPDGTVDKQRAEHALIRAQARIAVAMKRRA